MVGGKRQGDQRFCNDNCFRHGVLLTALDKVPRELIDQEVKKVHGGPCPKCQGEGPVDVHTSHRVWSALIMTSWASRPQICCRRCGIKAKVGDALLSGLAGWWGFPWGLIMTPLQVLRNLTGIFIAPDPTRPSDKLGKLVGLGIAERVAQIEAQGTGR